MRLTLSVVDPASAGQSRDVHVDAPAGATLGDVRRELLAAVGAGPVPVQHAAGPLTDGAVLGRPPLVDGAVLVAGGAIAGGQGVLELHVCAGPDAGRTVTLPPGEHVVGRGVDATVRVADPRLSRVHCRVRVTPDCTTLADLGSANGTTVGGRPVTRSSQPVRPGEVIAAGGSRLELVLPASGPPARVDGDGHVLVVPPPSGGGAAPELPLVSPTPPVTRDAARLPLVAIAVPALLGAGLLLVTRNPTYLLFVLLSPVTALGSWVGDRVDRRRAGRRDSRRFAADCARLQHEITLLAAARASARHERYPSLSRLAQQARAPDRPVWPRGPDHPDTLVLRLGLAAVPVPLSFSDEAGGPAAAPVGLDAVVLDDVPATVSLAAHAPLGLVGPLEATQPMLRSWLVQLACLQPPTTVRLQVESDGPAQLWSWLRWLPHAEAAHGRGWLAELDRRLESGDGPRGAAGAMAATTAWPRWVVVVDGLDVLRRLEAAARLLTEGPGVGIHAVLVARSPRELPPACRAVVSVGGDRADGDDGEDATLHRSGHPDLTGVRPDGASRPTAEAIARSLAPLREALPGVATGQVPPRTVHLLDLLAPGRLDPSGLATTWSGASTGPRRLAPVPIGVGADGGTVAIDLVADGPHLLVAGTTGAGKSELLQTLVASLAAAHRPDELAFVLVDFKGGAAFRECARLPHTIGLVTDLDPHAADRLLSSLRGLVSRREQALAEAGTPDLEHYRPTGGQSPMPRLVVVVDEFATLADELPDGIGELVSVARRGRSLGLHLVLATQRPAGVVSSDIRANIGLRLCLRVSDAGESTDVVDSPLAGQLAADLPGRGYLRRAGGGVEVLQTARVTGRSASTPARVRVRLVEVPAPDPTDDAGQSDLDRLVRSCDTAAAVIGARAPASPWLPPLPEHLPAELLAGSAGGRPATGSDGVRAGGVTVGRQDRPERGLQPPYRVDPVSRGLLVVGAPRSGRSQTLLTVATRLASGHPAADLHIYVLDGNSRALAALDPFPHCAALAAPDDPAFAARVLRRLAGELARREAQTRPERPDLLLLVDDWTAWRPTLDAIDGGRPVDDLLRLARSGPSAGLGVALSADREVLGSRLTEAFTDRLLLRLAERTDYAMAGVDLRRVPRHLPPGRGVLAPAGIEVQVFAPATPATPAAPTAPADHRPGAGHPWRLHPVPTRISAAVLPAALRDAGSRFFLGVGGDHAAPQSVDLADTPALVVAGPPRSGRSNVLRLMAAGARSRGWSLAVAAPPRSPLRAASDATLLGPDDADPLGRWLGSPGGPRLVLVDDVEAFHDSPLDDALSALLRRGGTGGPVAAHTTVIIAGVADDLSARFRGCTVLARRERCGLLLGELGPGEGDLLGVRLPRGPAGPPGRGLLVARGDVTPLQLALLEADPAERPRAAPSGGRRPVGGSRHRLPGAPGVEP